MSGAAAGIGRLHVPPGVDSWSCQTMVAAWLRLAGGLIRIAIGALGGFASPAAADSPSARQMVKGRLSLGWWPSHAVYFTRSTRSDARRGGLRRLAWSR
jgi:hypothetical protein